MSVLIVDDETDAVEELVELLEFRGFAARGSSNPLEVMDIVLADTSIDLVVVDIRMPGMSGQNLIKRLRSELPEARPMRIFVATGHANCGDFGAGFARVDAFFPKPIDLNGLIAAFTSTPLRG